MRLTALVLGCATLAACSSVEVAKEATPPPDMSKVMPTLRGFAAQAHLAEPLEFSGPMEAPSNYLERWMICVRSAAAPRKTYALLYQQDELKSSHMSATMDPCDSQTYGPVPAGEAVAPPVAPPPLAEKGRHHHHKQTAN
jgi:hypothetical protein